MKGALPGARPLSCNSDARLRKNSLHSPFAATSSISLQSRQISPIASAIGDYDYKSPSLLVGVRINGGVLQVRDSRRIQALHCDVKLKIIRPQRSNSRRLAITIINRRWPRRLCSSFVRDCWCCARDMCGSSWGSFTCCRLLPDTILASPVLRPDMGKTMRPDTGSLAARAIL